MKKILQFVGGAFIVVHIIGWGVTSVFFEWDYKNKNDVVKSYFLSGVVAQVKGFFWEYHLYNKLASSKKNKKNPIELRNYVFDGSGSVILEDKYGWSVQIVEDNKVIELANDSNMDGHIDECIYAVTYKPCSAQDTFTAQRELTLMYTRIDNVIAYMVSDNYHKFEVAFNKVHDEDLKIFKDNNYMSQSYYASLNPKYLATIDKRIKALK